MFVLVLSIKVSLYIFFNADPTPSLPPFEPNHVFTDYLKNI